MRRIISRGGSCSRRSSSASARRPHRRVQGVAGVDPGGVPFDGVRAGGYVFQIEMTYRASRLGARVAEVPITFKDRRVGQSKMSRRIVVEALFVVMGLRWDELRGRGPVPGAGDRRRPPRLAAGRGSGRHTRRRSARALAAPDRPGVRVVLDLRPIQDPDGRRSPRSTSSSCCGARRRPARRRVVLVPARSRPGRPDAALADLDVVGRRLLPPTRLLRSGALTVDPILLRGATLGAGWRAERGGAAGAVYHAAAGALPIASGIPIVAAVLDLAPWAMPEAYQRGTAARFGQRIRARLLRDAAAVLVPGAATAAAARRLLHVRKARLRVVPLAPRPGSAPRRQPGPRARRSGWASGSGTRCMPAATTPARTCRPCSRRSPGWSTRPPGAAGAPWPPRVCLVGATPDDRAALSRAAARAGVADAMAYAPQLPPERLAALVAGARFLVQPANSESTGLVALEAIAAGVPVVASAAGVLPEVVGSGRDPRGARRPRPARDRARRGLVG